MPSPFMTTSLSTLLIALLALVSAGAHAASAAAGRAKAPMCAACHGLDGRSQMPEAPNLAGQVEGYLVAQLQAFKAGTRHNEQMAIIARALSLQDMQDLAAYYASLDASTTSNAHP
jgi:cytochrome c553